MADPTKVYGETYARQATQSSEDILAKKLNPRVTKRKLYGFTLPGDVTTDISAEELSLALLSQGFCDNTTSHGVPHIYRASSTGKRVLWVILSLLSMGALIYHLSQLVSAYIKFDTSTSMTVNTSIRQLDFPAVTICNNNMIRTSEIDVSLNNLISDASNQDDRIEAKRDIAETIAYEYALMDDLELKWKLGHQFENMTIFAEYAYEDASDKFVHIFNPKHGNCYTYNHYSNENSATTGKAGAAHGLWLFMNIEQYEYVPFLTEASGVKVLIHDRLEMPFPEDGGVTVPPNTLTNLAMKKTEYTKINGRYGDCLGADDDAPYTIYEFEHGYPYSKAACQKSCLQHQIINECGCFVPDIPYNATFYNKVVAPCQSTGDNDACMDEAFANYTSGSLGCEKCKEPCRRDTYDVTASSTVWPAPTYMPDLKNEVQNDRPRLYQALKRHYELYDSIAVPIQENLLQIQIFYDRMSVTQISESPSVTDFQFISDLGGSLGLWVGWSMLTIFEFFEYSVDLLVLCLIKYQSNKSGRKTHPQSQRIMVQETTLHTH